MRMADIIAVIEEIAPPEAAAPWDASGLQVAATRQEAERVAVCLDPTPASLEAALRDGAHMILSHHPLLLKPVLPNRLDGYHEALRLLFTAGVPLYAAHTPLDSNSQGPAGWLARELDLRQVSVLEPATRRQDIPHLGLGIVGNVTVPMTVPQIAACVARHTQMTRPTLSGPIPTAVTRVAYCTGSGSSLLAAAKASGAELFITGDITYHTALGADICLLDVGHHCLEEEMMRRMGQLLEQRLPGVDVIFIPSSSPFRPLDLS